MISPRIPIPTTPRKNSKGITPVRLKMAGATHVGKVRKTNQDSLYFDEPQGIGIVADGIGGRRGGEIASSMVVDGLKRTFLESDKIRHEEINPFLFSAIDRVNSEILQRSQNDPSVNGMGTTLNCLMFVGDKLHLAHVGDSRTYLYFRENLWLLTLDHNIKTFLDRGWMPRASVHAGIKMGALVRSLGLSTRLEVDIYEIKLKPGEIFLTCSDGLSSMVDDRRIAAIIREHSQNIAHLPQALIDEANRNGGKDNTTVIVTQIRDED